MTIDQDVLKENRRGGVRRNHLLCNTLKLLRERSIRIQIPQLESLHEDRRVVGPRSR